MRNKNRLAHRERAAEAGQTSMHAGTEPSSRAASQSPFAAAGQLPDTGEKAGGVCLVDLASVSRVSRIRNMQRRST